MPKLPRKNPVKGVILVTAFEPFGLSLTRTNASWEAVKFLAGKRFGDKRIAVAQLPVAWGSATKKIQHLVKLHSPIAIIGFGQAGVEPVRLEKTARNIRQILTDNKGWLPSKFKIYDKGPRKIQSTLPLHLILNSLRAHHIPVKMFDNAGGYLCNEAFYTLMHDPGSRRAKTVPRGFIHLPPLGAKVKKVRFDRKTLQRIAEIVIQTVMDPAHVYSSKEWSLA